MDFKKYNSQLRRFGVLFLITLFITHCSENKKTNTDTFYVELVNFQNDTLRKQVAESIFGKVSFYKNNKLEILSANYVTEDFPDMHAFRDIALLDKKIKAGTRKIVVKSDGYFTLDSIEYALQKYAFKEEKWVKTSDMGVIKSINTQWHTKELAIEEFKKQIVNNIVEYTYN